MTFPIVSDIIRIYSLRGDKLTEKEIAKKMYSKIDMKIFEKKLTYQEVAKNIGTSKQNFSDQMLNLKGGKFINLRTLLKIQNFLGIKLISFYI